MRETLDPREEIAWQENQKVLREHVATQSYFQGKLQEDRARTKLDGKPTY